MKKIRQFKLIFHFISLQQKLDKIFSTINRVFTMFYYAFSYQVNAVLSSHNLNNSFLMSFTQNDAVIYFTMFFKAF